MLFAFFNIRRSFPGRGDTVPEMQFHDVVVERVQRLQRRAQLAGVVEAFDDLDAFQRLERAERRDLNAARRDILQLLRSALQLLKRRRSATCRRRRHLPHRVERHLLALPDRRRCTGCTDGHATPVSGSPVLSIDGRRGRCCRRLRVERHLLPVVIGRRCTGSPTGTPDRRRGRGPVDRGRGRAARRVGSNVTCSPSSRPRCTGSRTGTPRRRALPAIVVGVGLPGEFGSNVTCWPRYRRRCTGSSTGTRDSWRCRRRSSSGSDCPARSG